MFTLSAVNSTQSEPQNPGLEAAILVAGSPGALALLLSVEPQVVTNWRRRGVPPHRVLAVEQAVCGAVTRYELRPEIYGEKPADWVSPFVRNEPAAMSAGAG